MRRIRADWRGLPLTRPPARRSPRFPKGTGRVQKRSPRSQSNVLEELRGRFSKWHFAFPPADVNRSFFCEQQGLCNNYCRGLGQQWSTGPSGHVCRCILSVLFGDSRSKQIHQSLGMDISCIRTRGFHTPANGPDREHEIVLHLVPPIAQTTTGRFPRERDLRRFAWGNRSGQANTGWRPVKERDGAVGVRGPRIASDPYNRGKRGRSIRWPLLFDLHHSRGESHVRCD